MSTRASDALGVAQRGAQGALAPQAQASHHRLLDTEVVEQRDAVIRRVPEREGLSVPLRAAQPARVPANHAELGGQGDRLGIEHPAVEREVVSQDERRSVAARVLEVNALAV